MATIHRADSPVARCRVCWVQRQFHAKSDVPHSADRDHAFEAETVADYEPGDLTPEQLVREAVSNRDASECLTSTIRGDLSDEFQAIVARFDERARLCRIELKFRVRAVMGIDFDDLSEALA